MNYDFYVLTVNRKPYIIDKGVICVTYRYSDFFLVRRKAQ